MSIQTNKLFRLLPVAFACLILAACDQEAFRNFVRDHVERLAYISVEPAELSKWGGVSQSDIDSLFGRKADGTLVILEPGSRAIPQTWLKVSLNNSRSARIESADVSGADASKVETIEIDGFFTIYLKLTSASGVGPLDITLNLAVEEGKASPAPMPLPLEYAAVVPPPPQAGGITVTPSSASVEWGDTLTFTATPTGGYTMPANIVWEISLGGTNIFNSVMPSGNLANLYISPGTATGQKSFDVKLSDISGGVLFTGTLNIEIRGNSNINIQGNTEFVILYTFHGSPNRIVEENIANLPNKINTVPNSIAAYVTILAGSSTLSPLNISSSKNVIITAPLAQIKTLKMTGSNIVVESNAKLTLRGNISIVGKSNATAPLITVQSGGKLFLEEGASLMNNKYTTGSTTHGGAVNVLAGGEFIMNGGTIYNNSASYGGGVNVQNGATMTLNGGSINNNSASSAGGGINVNGVLYMNGGEIRRNSLSNASGSGAGVEISNFAASANASFTMSGGEIKENGNSMPIPKEGGGVSIVHWIDNNNTSIFTMDGGNISGNKADNGGGVSMHVKEPSPRTVGNGNGQFIMNGGTIKDNYMTGNGSALFMIVDNTNDKSKITAAYGDNGTILSITSSSSYASENNNLTGRR